jgi:peptide/nickel transport system permease protein
VEIMLGESAAPGDVATMRHALGLDRPFLVEAPAFVARLLRGDLGNSVTLRAPVTRVIAERLPATLTLALSALTLALALALPAGVLAALYPGSTVDRGVRSVSLAGTILPSIVLGPVLVLVFAIWLRWLPPSGVGGLPHLVLPTATLALGMVGVLTRLTRASMLTALRADHLRTARAKGATRVRLVFVHALVTAAPPVATVAGLQAGALLAGAIVTETIFGWPGIGRLVVQAIAARDYPLVQGCVLTIGFGYVVVNLATDAFVAWLDPRGHHAA